MSPIGRIFSVLNLILAVWFLAWAVQTAANNEEFQRQYSAEAEAHQRTRTESEDQVRRLLAEKQTTEGIAARLRDELEQAQLTVSRLEGELAAARNDAATQRDTAQRLSESYDALNATLESAIQSKDREFQARQEAEKARDESDRKAQEAQSTLADAQSQIRELRMNMEEGQTITAQLNKQIGDLETDINTLIDYTGVSRSSITSQPQIDASVVTANYDVSPGLIALNVGADNGVQRGFTFEIYDGGQYKGQVRIQNVHPTYSTALVVRGVDGAPIRQGDSASTRL